MISSEREPASPGDSGAAAPGGSRTAGLRALQQDLQRYLLGVDSTVESAIVAAPPLAVHERLGIYHNAYRVRLIEALDDTYPKLHAVLGDEVFSSLGESFVAAYPSRHRSIRWYGGELPEFLRVRTPFAAQPILAEIALLEWTLAEVFDAPDAEPIERSALAAVDPLHWGEIKLEFHPSVRRLDLEWNAASVWQAMSREESAPDPEKAERPVPWLLWRQHFNNYFRSMPADEAAALEAARRGDNFAEICSALSDHLDEEEIPLRAAGLLGVWADSGMIVALA